MKFLLLILVFFQFLQPLYSTELINKMITDPSDTTSLNINFNRMSNAVRTVEYKFRSSESCSLDIPKYAGIFCYDSILNKMYVSTGTLSSQFALLGFANEIDYIRNTASLQSGATFYVSSGSAQGTITSYGGFIGSGSSLTSLDASKISAGILSTSYGGTGSTSETDPQVGNNTTNYIPKWDGSALVAGSIYQNSTYDYIGIGTTDPGLSTLKVMGTLEVGFVGSASGVRFPDGTLQTTAFVGVSSGMIAAFATSCPSGWSAFTPLVGYFPRGAEIYGGTGGSTSTTHNHTLEKPTLGVFNDGTTTIADVTIFSTTTSTMPPYLDVVWCRKN